MKKIIKQSVALFIFLLLITSFSQAQTCLKWNIDIGGNDNTDSSGSVISVPDGFLVCGFASAGDENLIYQPGMVTMLLLLNTILPGILYGNIVMAVAGATDLVG